jgi:hypothetical protein
MAIANPSSPTRPVSGPSKGRYLTSYMARRTYTEAVQHPPEVYGVEGTIDIHCHAHEGQQDALALAKHASANGMGGLLYKTIVGRQRPAEAVRKVQEGLQPWCQEHEVKPVRTWAGWNIGGKLGAPPSANAVREQIEDGVAAIWMPNNLHANTFTKVGGRPIWWDKDADPHVNTPPMSWDEARRVGGHYLLADDGKLDPEVAEAFRIIADTDVAVFFGHATHPEIDAMAEQVQKLGIKKAVVDHPFSPFVDLDLEQMRQLTRAGIYMNFTYDELSPLIGVDPQLMCDTIRALGAEHVTLSSDAGEPLFPNTVEAMRLLRGHMRAFGLTDEEVGQASIVNPGKIVPSL